MHRFVLLLLAASLAGLSAAGVSRSSQSVRCPRRALPLTANSIAPASRVALAREKASARPQVTAAMLARLAGARGDTAKLDCGKRVWQRTVVVFIDLRAYHPSASLSERVSLVSRLPSGYRVWLIEH